MTEKPAPHHFYDNRNDEKPVPFLMFEGRDAVLQYPLLGSASLAGAESQSLHHSSTGKDHLAAMKTVREVMTQDLVTVAPSSTVKTAIILMRGHEIGALPVVNNEALLGLIECHQLLGQDPGVRIGDLMRRDFVSVSPDLPVNKAAEVMARAHASRLVVEENGTLVGMLTHSDVLPELGRSYDPLTGLPWSDTLREWAVEQLSSGREISIVFFDVDLFGAFNKNYGHVTGDSVLKSICAVFKGLREPETDMLCRMGGDEFVVGTVRSRQQALLLAEAAAEQVSRLTLEAVPEPIRVSYGISGGRRTREREATHYAATVDDLLNRASKECTAMKREKRGADALIESVEIGAHPVVLARGAGAQRLRIQQIDYSCSEAEMRIDVRLSLGDRVYQHSVTGFPSARSVARLAADAAAAAIQQALPEGHRLAAEDVVEMRLPGTSEAVLVSTIVLATQREETPYYGIALVRRGDPHRAAVASVLSAINRPLERLLEAPASTH